MSQLSESDEGNIHHPNPRPNPQVESESRGASSKHSKEKGKKGLQKKRDTHFLCFPLVTDTSVPQLAHSLRHFREVSTQPPRQARRQVDNNADTEASDNRTDGAQPDPAESVSDSTNDLPEVQESRSLPSSNEALQLLPPVTHRPPGTFHLTLGVMDLSKQEEMDRAVSLLQELDYADIFRTALSLQTENESYVEQSESRIVTEGPGAGLSSLNRPVSPPPTSVSIHEPKVQFSQNNLPQICLTGLSTFPSAKSSRVFFAKPSPSPSTPFPLLKFGQAIRRKFREAGFITETRPLVLHATVANMRYAVQAHGGRTSKGKAWRFGKDRWTDGQVDAREMIKCFDVHGGDVGEYIKGHPSALDAPHEFVWARDIVFNKVAICKMGAEKSDDEVLGQVYPPVSEKLIFS